MSEARLEQLREKWERAVEKNKHGDAVAALAEIERLDDSDPLWAHRLGDAYRRANKLKEAEDAFVRAADKYVAKGFLPRAIAMAKLVETLSPARKEVLARIAKKEEPPKPAFFSQPMPARPTPLSPAKDAKDDEVRFEDAPESSVVTVLGSVDIVLEDVSGYERLSSLDIMLPEPREPSIDRLGTMAGFQLFAGVSRDAMLDLSAATKLTEFDDGQIVFLKDAPATELYAIVGGVARVHVPGTQQEIRLEEGEIFGEGCLLGEGKRHADVHAGPNLMTLEISKSALDEITKKHSDVRDALFQLLVKRLLTNLMSTSPLFAAFDPPARLELTNMFEVRRADSGTVIAEKGRKSDGLYLLLAGELETTGQGGRIPRGTAFGHTSLFGGGTPSEQTVKARSEVVLLRLAASKFGSLAAQYPPVLAHLATETDLLTS